MPAKYRYPVKRSPKSDPQQYRVYRMENEAIGARQYQRLPRGTIRKLATAVCRAYRVPVVGLIWGDLGKWAAEWNPPEVTRRAGWIVLNTKKNTARDVLTITHELAHHIHYWLSDNGAAGQEAHGPQFMACHISILDTCRIIPVVGMRAICGEWKVSFADPGTSNSLRVLRDIVSKK